MNINPTTCVTVVISKDQGGSTIQVSATANNS
jgi:hypothetical protein